MLERFRHAQRPVIVIHDFPDPDAIASGLGMARLLEANIGLTAPILHGGTIARAENRALVDELDIHLTTAATFDWSAVDQVALLDSQPGSGNHSLPKTILPAVVIDHHPLVGHLDAKTLADVRPDYGATCTIITEYLEDAQVHISEQLATALFYGIKTDTQDLGRQASGIDALAYRRLFVAADTRALARIQNPRLPHRYFRALHDALEAVKVTGDVAVAYLGTLAMPEMTGEMADLIIRLDDLRWCLAIGRYQDRLIFSLRASESAADAGEVAQKLAAGHGFGGGHWRVAGGFIDIGKAADDDSAAGTVIARFLELIQAQGTESPMLMTAQAPPEGDGQPR